MGKLEGSGYGKRRINRNDAFNINADSVPASWREPLAIYYASQVLGLFGQPKKQRATADVYCKGLRLFCGWLRAQYGEYVSIEAIDQLAVKTFFTKLEELDNSGKAPYSAAVNNFLRFCIETSHASVRSLPMRFTAEDLKQTTPLILKPRSRAATRNPGCSVNIHKYFIRAAKRLDDEAGVPKYLRKHHNMVMLFTYVLARGISIQHICLKNFKKSSRGQFQTSEGPMYYLQLSDFLVKGGKLHSMELHKNASRYFQWTLRVPFMSGSVVGWVKKRDPYTVVPYKKAQRSINFLKIKERACTMLRADGFGEDVIAEASSRTPHDMRHSGATIIGGLTTNRRDIQMALGHSSAVQSRRYTHTTVLQTRRASEILNNVFDDDDDGEFGGADDVSDDSDGENSALHRGSPATSFVGSDFTATPLSLNHRVMNRCVGNRALGNQTPSKPAPVAPQELQELFERFHLSQYMSHCVKEGFDTLDEIEHMTAQDLVALELPRGHHKRFQRMIKSFLEE